MPFVRGVAETRVTLWCDMEGVCGIVNWEQVGPRGGEVYQEGRRLFAAEVDAAVRGAKRAGADEIVVVDCHGAGAPYTFRSLLVEELEPGAEYVLGAACYVEPLEGWDAALCMGAHAMAGTADGVLSPTVSSERWRRAWIDDTPLCGGVWTLGGCRSPSFRETPQPAEKRVRFSESV